MDGRNSLGYSDLKYNRYPFRQRITRLDEQESV